MVHIEMEELRNPSFFLEGRFLPEHLTIAGHSKKNEGGREK